MFTRPEGVTDDEVRDALASTWSADVASFAADLRAPHDDDEDTRTARAGLRAVLEEGEP